MHPHDDVFIHPAILPDAGRIIEHQFCCRFSSFGASGLGSSAIHLFRAFSAAGSESAAALLDSAGTHINAGGSTASFGIDPINGPYTAMAWVNFANQTGDNMVFGSSANGRLHLGARGDQYYSGHWSDDIGSNQGGPDPTESGVWHHVAFTNDGPGSTGQQEIYVDGVSVGFGAITNDPGSNAAGNLLLGNSGNGGSFNGMIDEVKIFDTQLTQAEIIAQIATPEPSRALLLLGAFVGVSLTRRKRRV